MIELVLKDAAGLDLKEYDQVRVPTYPPIDSQTEWIVNGVRYRPARYGDTTLTTMPRGHDAVHRTEVWVRKVNR